MLIFHEAGIVSKRIIHSKFDIDSHLTMFLKDVYPEERLVGMTSNAKKFIVSR
jgi:hypothetical protein